MRMEDVPTEELERLRDAYKLDLRNEKQASGSVRRMWSIVVIALDDILRERKYRPVPDEGFDPYPGGYGR